MLIPKQLCENNFRFCLITAKNKIPFEQKWQTENNYDFNDERLLQHINNGGNYGIIGGYGNLLIIDFDNKEFQNKYLPILPETFTVMSGSGGLHLYYLCDDCPSLKILDENKNTLADIQGRGKQVVAPGSTHPNGNQYKIHRDIPIGKITIKNIQIIFADYLKDKHQFIEKYDSDNLIQNIKKRLNIESLLSYYNYDLSKNPTMCKLGHNSKGQKCFSFNTGKDLWYCHHCEEGGDIFSLVMLHEKCDFPTAKEFLRKMAGLKQETNNNEVTKVLTIPELREQIFEIIINKDIKDKDDRITELIVNFIISNRKIRTIRCDEKDEVWIYNEGIYIPEGKTYIKELIRSILKKAHKPSLINKVIEKIKADTFIAAEEFFTEENCDLIAVENGILNIKTKELNKFSPKYKFFNKIPVVYNPDKKCDKVIAFLNDVIKDPSDIFTLQELFGYLLYRRYEIEKAFMFTGSGRNGKSKTIELMKRFIGEKNCANIPIQSLDKDQFAMGELFNKLANLSADISKTALDETGKFKSLIGRDLVSASRKFLTMVHFQNYAKMIFSANELPVTYDITPAFFMRWVIVDFPWVFVSKREYEKADEVSRLTMKTANPSIIQEITSPDEMSGLLNWALEGLERLLQKGDFSYGLSNVEVKNMWLRKSSSIHAFIMDKVLRKFDSKIPKQEFLEAYLDYCSLHKISSVNEKMIKNTLETTIGCTEYRPDIEGERVLCWKGIILK